MRSRQKIVDATLEVITSDGFSAASIAGVAKAAGVSRQTVYSIFGSREELVSQALTEVAFTAMATIHQRLDGITDMEDLLIEYIIAGRAMAITDPILSMLMTPTENNPFFDDGAMARTRAVTAQVLRPVLQREPAYVARLDDIVEMGALLSTYLVALDDSGRSDDEVREFLGMWLRPALRHLVAAPHLR